MYSGESLDYLQTSVPYKNRIPQNSAVTTVMNLPFRAVLATMGAVGDFFRMF